jgi:hypothetical protein
VIVRSTEHQSPIRNCSVLTDSRLRLLIRCPQEKSRKIRWRYVCADVHMGRYRLAITLRNTDAISEGNKPLYSCVGIKQ